MPILRPLNARALGQIMTTAARRYRTNAGATRIGSTRRPAGTDAPVPGELHPRWLRFVVDNQGG